MPRLHVSGLALMAGLAGATGAVAQTAAAGPEIVDEVVVTGTRAEGRKPLESLAPVDVVRSEEIAELGYPDVARGLEFLEPSVNFARSATTATAANSRPVTLRGLAPDQVLVLVNGKRRHATSILNTNNAVGRGSAGVDLDTIPGASVGRIEILRDGAAAQYGSDAIGGVVNIILRGVDDGGFASIQASTTEEGDGDAYAVSGWVGLPLGEEGHVTLSGEYRDQQPTNRANLDQRFNRVTYRFGDPDLTLLSFGVDASLPIAGGEAYAFGTLTRKRSENAAGFRVPGFSPVWPNGFLPKIRPLIWDGAVTVGWRATLAEDWRFDLSNTYGQNKASFDVVDTANQTLGAASPTEFYSGAVTYRQNVVDATVSRPLPFWAGGNFAAGAQYRHEAYEIESGEPLAYTGVGADGFPGFNPRNPTDKSRIAYAAFADLELKPVEALTLGGAVRYDHYGDFGGKVTWKASGRFEVTDWLALRSTIGTGFRAPSLQQQYFSAVAGALSAGRLVTVGTLPVADPVARALGASKLKPETSISYAAGFVLDPGFGLTLTADWFRIEIEDRIALSEQLGGASVTAVLNAAGITGFQQVRFFTNAVDTTTDGFELTARYRRALTDDTDLSLALGYGRFDTRLDVLRPNPALPGLPLLALKSVLYVTEAQPKDKLTFEAQLTHGPFSVQANVTDFGTYVSQPLVPVQVFGGKTVLDVSGYWKVNATLKLSAGVQNLTDERPDALIGQQAVVAATGGSFPTGEESPIGVNGRSYFVRLEARF